jgi:hypothetical protein
MPRVARIVDRMDRSVAQWRSRAVTAGALQSAVDQAALRQFAQRDWTATAAAKLDYWAEQYRQHGPDAARRASTALWQHAQRVHPEFPSDADRSRDLAHHVDLRERLDRASRALARR